MVLLGMLLISGLAVAQKSTNTTFQVRGVLLDSLTHDGEPYATIKVVKKENPEKAVKMFVTAADGKFQEKINGRGNFVITLSSVGRKPVIRDFTVQRSGQVVDLGTLYITDAVNELGVVEVVAQKPLVKSDIDKIEYNIQDDPDAETNSVLEMLRKVPMVTVDGEDNIQVNGSSSFQVYVNGKPNNMMTNNPTEVLKSMPANTIKHIEVITNPGAKYDAEGVGGILNIVTIGGGFEGYTVTISGRARNTGVGGGFFGTVQKGKFTLSARYDHNYNDNPRRYSGGTRRTVGQVTANSSDLEYYNTSKGRTTFQAGSLEASYEIDTLRLLSASFGMWGGRNKNDAEGNTTATMPGADNLLYKYSTVSHNESSWYSIDGGIDYQRLFSVKDRMLTFSYKINTHPETSDSYTTYEDNEAAADWEAFLRRMQDQHNDGSQNTTEHTLQADFTTPFGELHSFETGVKYIRRNNISEDDRYVREAGTRDEYVFDEDYSSHYRHVYNILAAYAGYALKMKKLSGRVGVRYEHTIEDVEYRLGRGDDFTKNFDDVVPSISLGWKLSDLSNLRLGYNMRIYRPGIWALNPYLDDSNPTNVSQGNPNLESEKNHNFTFGYSNFTSKFNLNLSVRYGFSNNGIESVSTLMRDSDIPGLMNPTGKEVLYTTYRNIGKSKRVAFSGYVNWNATATTRLYANAFGGYTYMEGANGQRNDGWNVAAFGGIQQTLPKDWRISLNCFGMTPWLSLQGEGNSYFDYSININKSFLKKRLTVSAFASNFAKKYNRETSNMADANFVQDSWNRYSRQRFGMSISYRFGDLKASVKKVARGISNDDVKTEGGEGVGE